MKANLYFVPVSTLSPLFTSDIVTDFPFSRFILAVDGKHPGGGGGGTIKQTLGVTIL